MNKGTYFYALEIDGDIYLTDNADLIFDPIASKFMKWYPLYVVNNDKRIRIIIKNDRVLIRSIIGSIIKSDEDLRVPEETIRNLTRAIEEVISSELDTINVKYHNLYVVPDVLYTPSERYPIIIRVTFIADVSIQLDNPDDPNIAEKIGKEFKKISDMLSTEAMRQIISSRGSRRNGMDRAIEMVKAFSSKVHDLLRGIIDDDSIKDYTQISINLEQEE